MVIVSTLVYHNALNNPFQYDDQISIEENSYLRKAGVIRDIFTHPGYYVKITKPGAGHYRPLLFITFLLNYRLGGLNVVGYHLINLVFHIGSAFMLFLIVQAVASIVEDKPPRYNQPVAAGDVAAGDVAAQDVAAQDVAAGFSLRSTPVFIALASALIFAVHPFNSEVVNYITARSSVMSGFFYLLAFYCWVQFRNVAAGFSLRDQGGIPRNLKVATTPYYLTSLLAFLLGMLTKEVVITLPVVLWLYDLYFYRSSPGTHGTQAKACGYIYLLNWRTYIAYLPFFLLVAIPYIVLRMSFTGAMFPTFKRDLLTQFYTEIPVLVKYIRLFFLPVGLNVDHYVSIYSGPSLPVMISSFFLILFIAVAIYLYRAEKIEWRIVSFFVIWFLIVLLPTTVIPLNAIMQENRGYLAAAGMAGVLGIALGQVAVAAGDVAAGFSLRSVNVAGVKYAILGLLLLSFSLTTLHRNSLWGDRISLWSDAVSKSPLSANAHVNLGVGYAAKGMYRKGERELLTALRLDDPPPFDIHLNLGSIYHTTGRLDTALKEYQKASGIQPGDFRPHYGLGVLYQQKEDLEAAIKEYKKVIELNPNDFRTYHNLGVLHQNNSDYDTAIRYYKKALSINPDYAKSAFNLGKIYENLPYKK